jgi:hypothetical protein
MTPVTNPIQLFYESAQDRLMASYRSDAKSPTPIKGTNRETFVTAFLERAFPRHIRFGSGVILDQKGNMSGQCDIVAEWPWGPSLQFDDNTTRYYFADLIAAVVSVKSDLKGQWGQVQDEMAKLKAVDFTVNPIKGRFQQFARSAPMFCVGYQGFQEVTEAQEKFKLSPYDQKSLGMLTIESGVYVSGFGEKPRSHSGWSGLHCFITDLVDQSLSVMMEPDLRGYLSVPEKEFE